MGGPSQHIHSLAPLKERGFYRARPHGGGPMASPWNPTQPNIFQTHSHALLFLSTKQDMRSRLELADATWAVFRAQTIKLRAVQ